MTRTIRARRAEPANQPLYARILRLRHLAPSGLLCFVFLEGAVVLGILLALAELVSWWGVIVLPVTVALMVKFNDLVAGAIVPRVVATETTAARAAVLRPAAMFTPPEGEVAAGPAGVQHGSGFGPPGVAFTRAPGRPAPIGERSGVYGSASAERSAGYRSVFGGRAGGSGANGSFSADRSGANGPLSADRSGADAPLSLDRSGADAPLSLDRPGADVPHSADRSGADGPFSVDRPDDHGAVSAARSGSYRASAADRAGAHGTAGAGEPGAHGQVYGERAGVHGQVFGGRAGAGAGAGAYEPVSAEWAGDRETVSGGVYGQGAGSFGSYGDYEQASAEPVDDHEPFSDQRSGGFEVGVTSAGEPGGGFTPAAAPAPGGFMPAGMPLAGGYAPLVSTEPSALGYESAASADGMSEAPAVGYPGSYSRGLSGGGYSSGAGGYGDEGQYQVRSTVESAVDETRVNNAPIRRAWADELDVRQQMARQAASRRYE
jgi:hypothetical protein